MVALLHSTAFFAARSWSDCGSSKLAHGSAAGLLVLWPLLAAAGPVLVPAPDPPDRLELAMSWSAWLVIGLVVLGLGALAADREPAVGAHRQAVLGRGTFLSAVALLVTWAGMLGLFIQGAIRVAGPMGHFLAELPGACLMGGVALGLTCAYAGLIEVRRQKPAPGWLPFSLVLLVVVAIYSLFAVVLGLEGLLA